MLLVLVLMFTGVFSTPLSFCIQGVLSLLCSATGLPMEMLALGSNFLELLFLF